MERFVASLQQHITPEDMVNLEACMDCGLCGEACAWYLATGNQQLHPRSKTKLVRSIYRRYLTIEGKLGGPLGLVPTPTEDDLRERMEYFWKCTACGRCTLACPAGISNRRLVRLARMAYADSGLSRENPTRNAIIQNLARFGHSMGLEPLLVLARYGLFLAAEGIEMPVDVEGAEILFVCPSAANTKIPDYAIKVMKILNAANISYTVSSQLVETGTEADHVVADHHIARQVLEAWEGEAKRLNAQKLLVVECGCDTRTMFADATEVLGRPLQVAVILFDPLISEQIEAGVLPVDPVDTPITLHDPCNSTRLSGLGDTIRELLNKITTNFIEMTPNREYNYCCNGGAGGMRLPENASLRREVSVLKANQIRNTGADMVTTPCVVCMLTLEDTCQTYKLSQPGQRMATLLFEVLHDAMDAALTRRGERDRMHMPLLLQGRDEEFLSQHSVMGLMTALMHHPEAFRVLDWLEQNEVVQRHANSHPQVWEQLQRFRDMAVEAQTLELPPVTLELGRMVFV